MSCYFDFVNETKDIGDLANCDGATEGRTDTTSYRDAETHLNRYSWDTSGIDTRYGK